MNLDVGRLGAALLVVGLAWAVAAFLVGRHTVAVVGAVVASLGLVTIAAVPDEGAA